MHRHLRNVALLLISFITICGAAACAPNAAPAPGAQITPSPAFTATETLRPTWTAYPTRTPLPTSTPWPKDAPPLRQLAEKRGLYIGVAVQSGLIANDAAYRDTLRREFNLVTAEYEMKMCGVWPERARWSFTAGDAIVQFAQENNMKVRGHTLVWIDCVPDWLKNGSFSKEEATAILREYITTMVGRYKGKIYAWDVINEPVDRGTVWDKLIGPEYARLAFKWVHEADPAALLFYNDFNIETPNGKFDNVYKFVKELKDASVPIDGVGMQMHLTSSIPVEGVSGNMQKLAELGLQVQITEFDLPLDHFSLHPLADQAETYGNILRACLQVKNCTAFVMWGFTDQHTWLTQQLEDPFADPLIFDRNYQPKPAYEALFNVLSEPDSK